MLHNTYGIYAVTEQACRGTQLVGESIESQ
jgi:hypothetical protein